MVFICGIEGAKDNEAEQFEELVIQTLNKIINDDIDLDFLSSLLDQLELQQREVGGSSYPYGLQLMLSSLPTALHRGNADAVLNIDPILSELRIKIKDPEFIKSRIKNLLLDNSHE